jgi:hypothetical protein
VLAAFTQSIGPQSIETRERLLGGPRKSFMESSSLSPRRPPACYLLAEMQLPLQLRFALSIIASCLSVQGQPPQTDKGMPPRSTPGDYQAHAQAGAVTLGAEFLGTLHPHAARHLSQQKTMSWSKRACSEYQARRSSYPRMTFRSV